MTSSALLAALLYSQESAWQMLIQILSPLRGSLLSYLSGRLCSCLLLLHCMLSSRGLLCLVLSGPGLLCRVLSSRGFLCHVLIGPGLMYHVLNGCGLLSSCGLLCCVLRGLLSRLSSRRNSQLKWRVKPLDHLDATLCHAHTCPFLPLVLNVHNRLHLSKAFGVA
jgi:hypothetical protein